ncbi:MAG: response regulator [Polyangiaceae bacterium]
MDKSKATVVLIADDEPSMLSLVSSHVKVLGFEVLIAHDGQEAWNLAQIHHPDLILLDVMMPNMSGWEVCRNVRRDDSFEHTGVVMITGIGERMNEMNSPIFGADAYLDKPFEFADLDRTIREVLAARRGEEPQTPEAEPTGGETEMTQATDNTISKAAAGARAGAKLCAVTKKALEAEGLEDRRDRIFEACKEEGSSQEARREEGCQACSEESCREEARSQEGRQTCCEEASGQEALPRRSPQPRRLPSPQRRQQRRSPPRRRLPSLQRRRLPRRSPQPRRPPNLLRRSPQQRRLQSRRRRPLRRRQQPRSLPRRRRRVRSNTAPPALACQPPLPPQAVGEEGRNVWIRGMAWHPFSKRIAFGEGAGDEVQYDAP